jgi:chemotaxis protein MotA
MEKSTIIGLILAVAAVGGGMVLKGASIVALLNPAAILIIFVGTAATLFIGFSLEELKVFPKLVKIVFTEQKMVSKKEIMHLFAGWAALTRREGLLSLEGAVEDVKEPFLKSGLRLIIDGNDQDFVRELLLEDVSTMEERHRSGAQIFTQAGTYAPTLGVLGAVVGLIAALSNLNEVEKLGHLISAAFVATLLGIFSGYVLWHPIANKLKQKSKKEVELKLMMIEGILSIQTGISAAAVTQKLMVFIPSSQRGDDTESEAGSGDEQTS